MYDQLRRILVGGLVAAALAACGGGGYGGSSNSGSPSAPSGTSASMTVAISGVRGAQSFTPNPLSAQSGQTVAWKNNDSLVHHIVFNDGSLDTGDLAPGATSRAFGIGAGAAQYHCSIHPEMVGSVNAPTNTPSGAEPCADGAGYC